MNAIRAPWRHRALTILGAATVALSGLALSVAPAHAGQSVVVSPTPVASAPRVMNGRVYSIDTYGPLVVVGGSFTNIRAGGGGADVPRQWIFMYNSETGAISSTFVPQLTGPTPQPDIGYVKDQPGVESVKFAPDGQSVYVGGWFTSANGVARQRLVRLNLDGSLDATFTPSFNNYVTDLALTGNRLIVGGRFGQANGQPADRLISVDPTTGVTQTDFNIPATVSRNQYAGFVQELEVSDNGRWLAVTGSFKKLAGLDRNQLGLVDLQGTPKVANWSTDLYAPNCSQSSTDFGSYIRGIAFDPTTSFLIVNSTGAFIGTDTMCDSAARFELPPTATGDNLSYTWRAKTGGDTLWAAEVTDAAVYVGGHQRWLNNPRPSPGGDNDGPGSVARPGIAALDPLTGVPLSWNPGRDRGRGVEALLATDNYLFVGHDTDLFGGAVRQRLAQLPVAGGTANPQPTTIDLPVNLYFTDGSALGRVAFDGATLGSPSNVSGPGIDSESWSTNRGGFVQNGKLHYFGASQKFYSRPFSDTSGLSLGAPTDLSTTVGYVDTNYNNTPYDQPYGVAETTAATYSKGRIYYVKSGDTKLYQRGYSLESGIVEGSEYVASSQSFASARAINFIGDWLYAAWSDGRLYRFYAPNGRVDYQSKTLVDDGTTVDWEDVRGFWSTPGSGSAVQPTPPSLTCADTTPWKASYWPNITLAGAPNATRCEAAINYNYGNSGPSGADVGTDNFSATWTRTIDLAAPGAIKITASVDDGVRAYVDGKRVIESWVDSSAVTRTGTSEALTAGAHQVRIEMYERTGSASAQVSTEVVAPPTPPAEPDNLPGDTDIATPTENQVIPPGSTLTTTGTATDNVGVTEVRVAIYNRDGGASTRWLQANGSWGSAYAWRPATLSSPGGTSTGWSLGGISLPQGNFAVDARTADAAGFVDPTKAYRQFSVSSTVPDTTRPQVTVTSPTSQQKVTTSTVTTTGTATDNIGVTQVRVGIYNRAGDASTRWLQADGTWGPAYVFRTATLGTPGGTSTSWSLDVTLPDGIYAFDVRALDAAKNETNPRAWTPFSVSTVVADTTAPTATVTAPVKNSTVSSNDVAATGTTADDTAVNAVRVGIYNRAGDASSRWLQTDGTWGATYAYRSASLASPGTTASDWSLALNLPNGLYAFDVRPVDAANNIGASTWHPFTVNAPAGKGVAPTATVAKVGGAKVSGRRVALSGSAKDDTGVRRVLVAVARTNGGHHRWLQAGGRFTHRQVFRWATLTRPGGRATGWRLRLSLPRGSYAVTVLATDKSSNVQRSAATRHFRVNTGA